MLKRMLIFDNILKLTKNSIIAVFLSVALSCSHNNPIVIISTQYGDIEVELFEEKAPITSSNFMRYVDENRYLGATFYRVVKANNQPNSKVMIEVIQGGLYEDNHPQNLPPIIHENTKQTGILHKNGVISMARYEPGTATFEFFICIGDQPSLDYGGERNPDNEGFAAFGKVINGIEIVYEIHNLPDSSQYLVPRISINNMKVIR